MWIPETATPTRKTRRVIDILQDIGISSGDTTLQIVVDNTTIADNAMVLDLWLKYGDFLYSQSIMQHFFIDESGTPREIDCGYIITEWVNFIDRNGENLSRMLTALFSDYNPIENYSMTESGADGDREDKTEISPTGTTTNTQYGAGVNSTGDGAVMGKNVTSYENAKSTTTPTNTQTMQFNGDTYTGYYKAREHYFKRAGNIGVTTSAQMIGQEIELRKYCDLISDFVHTFIMQYCYFVG